MRYQKRKVPCKYCPNTIQVSRYAFEELNYMSGVCDECKVKIQNAKECETCHVRVFQGCDECKRLNVQYYNHGEKLYHKSTDGFFDQHVCEHHWNEYIEHVKVIAGYYD